MNNIWLQQYSVAAVMMVDLGPLQHANAAAQGIKSFADDSNAWRQDGAAQNQGAVGQVACDLTLHTMQVAQ